MIRDLWRWCFNDDAVVAFAARVAILLMIAVAVIGADIVILVARMVTR